MHMLTSSKHKSYHCTLVQYVVKCSPGALPRDVTNASALVAGLGPRIGAVLHNVTHLQNVNQLLVSSTLSLDKVPRHAFRN